MHRLAIYMRLAEYQEVKKANAEAEANLRTQQESQKEAVESAKDEV